MGARLSALLLLASAAAASQLSYQVPVKKGDKVVSVFSEGQLQVMEEKPLPGWAVYFSEFKVKKEGDKLVLEWRAASPEVKKVLVITDGGLVLETPSERIEIPASDHSVISVYPVTERGGWGLPATVKLGG
ncbi:MAG: hypothetical protein GXO08_05450 [Aquificae bacterium]|nr:hypothetical protein [Aquificota bacterium]